MKTLIKILIFLMAYTSIAIAYNPAAYVDATFVDEDENVETVETLNEANSQIVIEERNKRIEEVGNLIVEKQKETANASISTYFVDYFEYSDSELICPPLKIQFQSSHKTVIENVNYRKGSITCSVRNSAIIDEKSEVKNFINDIYINELNSNIDPMHLLHEEAIEASTLYSEKIENIKDIQKYKFQQNEEQYDSDTRLDRADLLDALVVSHREQIDLNASLNSNQIVLGDGYSLQFTPQMEEEEIENMRALYEFKKNLNKDISDTFNIKLLDDDNYHNELLHLKNEESASFESFFLHILRFVKGVFYEGREEIKMSLFLITFFAFAYKMVSYTIEARKNNTSYFNVFAGPALISTIATVLFIANIEEESIMPTNIVQDYLITPVNTEINKIADKLVLEMIDITSDSIVNGSTITSSDRIKNIILENEKLKRAVEKAVDLNKVCEKTFDTDTMVSESKYKSYFDEVKNNPFIPESYLKKVNDSNWNLYTNSGYTTGQWQISPININTCYQNKNYINNTTNVIKYNNLLIDRFNSIDFSEAEFQEKEFLVKRLYNLYNRKGYLAINSIHQILTAAELSNFVSKKTKEYEQLIFSGDMEELSKLALRNAFLTLTVGDGFMTFFKQVFSSLTSAAVGWIPLIGDSLSSASSGIASFAATTVVVDMGMDLFEMFRTSLLAFVATLMLYFNFIVKLAVYLFSMFAVYRILLDPSKETLFRILIKIISVYFKLLLIIISIFLCFEFIDFFHANLVYTLENWVLYFTNGWLSFATINIIAGAAELLIVFLEILLGFYMIFKLPSSILDYLEVSAEKISEILTDAAGSIQHKVTK